MASPVGEDSWIAYLEEAERNASDLEQCVNVVESYKRAVSAEPGSLRLWVAYCSFFQQLCENGEDGCTVWTGEEQSIGRELFPSSAALDLWQQGYQHTQFRLSDSHKLWDRWLDHERKKFTDNQNSEGLDRITLLYRQRLSTPHLTWEDTSQSFSSFLSAHRPADWEDTMKAVTVDAQETKQAIQERDPFELKLKHAERSDDVQKQKTLLREYIDWELREARKTKDKAALSWKLCSGLFDRALTGHFSTDEEVWLDYVVFLSSSVGALDACRRAVEHCPGSGHIWSRYLLCAEEAQLSMEEIESIKDSSAGNQQLCRDGVESMIELYAAWCAYLKRLALTPASTAEEVGVVESKLRAALKEVMAAGKKLYGKEFQGDPKYRLERILIQFLTQKNGAIEQARAVWKKLARNRVIADSYEFWLSYYAWEMLIFSSSQANHSSSGHPSEATLILHSAAARKSVDWPEKILDLYLQHCDLYETPIVALEANNFVHQERKVLARRRKDEEEAQAAQYAAYYEAQAQAQVSADIETQPGSQPQEQQSAGQDTTSPIGKRKFDSLTDKQANDHECSSKRQRNGVGFNDSTGAGLPPQRDREHSTILVTNLPFEATQTEVKKYFKPYGHIKNITAFVKDEQRNSTTALIEFGSTQEAQSALLRDAKYFGESAIAVQPGHDLTVYVANFPPAADEQFIRRLFKDCGEILSIRWPSLKVNSHRRFCYISFLDPNASARAVAKEGKLLDGKYRLLAKYSDPGRKKSREGAVAERREVHISNLDRSTTEAELRGIFDKFGTVARVNIPLDMAGRSRGFAFVEFETKDQAEKAVEELNNTKFRSQILLVELSQERKVKPTAKSNDLQQSSASPAPNDGGEGAIAGATADADEEISKPSSSDIAAKTIALLGLPDTVNDARVRALVEPLGNIVKLVHQPGRGGAIIEFSDAATAGKAALQLNSLEYEGHQLRTGSPDELRQHKQQNGIDDTKTAVKPRNGLIPPPQAIRRTALGRGGPKRGGLGFASRKAVSGASTEAVSSTNKAEPSSGAHAPKSNADFKAMFLAGRQEGKGGG